MMTRTARRMSCLAGTLALVLSSAAFAQSTPVSPMENGPTTRASEKADLKNLEAHGYRPQAQDPNYPNDIQKAEKSAYGTGSANGAANSPAPAN